MFEYKYNGEFYEVWDDYWFDKEILVGALRKNDEGYYQFHPGRKVVLSCKMLRDIAEKLSELNT